MGTRSSIRLVIASLLLSTLCFADSQIRIVRLSSVDGNVQIDRNTGQGFEKAFLNVPITQGVKLQTGSDGRAEVEFEDGSVIRLAPASSIEFSQLSLKDSGIRISDTTIQRGTAYISFRGGKADEFIMHFGHETVALKEATHFRIQINDTDATFSVFKGDTKVEGASGSADVGKNQSVTFDLANHDQYKSAKLEDASFDTWDKEQSKYHDTYLSKNHDYSPYAYGMSDLNYYGNFFSAPGYGPLWQPYFVGAGWDPFMQGSWLWSPGSGYSWVSAYPWGWTPYHCGSWLFGQSFGWAWQPGGCGNGFGFPPVFNAPVTFVPPQPPVGRPGHGTIVMVPRPIVPNSTISTHRMVIERNSAGLGIPRGGIRDLPRLSTTVKKNGTATASFRPTPPPMTARPMINNSGMSRPTSPNSAPPVSRPMATPSMSAPSRPMAPSHSSSVPRGTTRK
jgi:hypothetical protein